MYQAFHYFIKYKKNRKVGDIRTAHHAIIKHFEEPLDLHNKLFVILDYNQTDKVNQFAGKNLRSIPRLGLCQFTLNKHQIVIQASRPIIKVMIVFNSWLLIFKKKSYEQI